MEKNHFENFEKLFFEKTLNIFRRKNVFWGKSENHPKIENQKSDFWFSVLGWFSKFPQKIFFRRKIFKKFSKKKLFEIFKINFLHDEKIFFVRIFFKVQELDHTVPMQPTTPPNSASARFGQGISAGGPWICQLVIYFRTRLHVIHFSGNKSQVG